MPDYLKQAEGISYTDSIIMGAARQKEAQRVLAAVDAVEQGNIEFDQLIPTLVNQMQGDLVLSLGAWSSPTHTLCEHAQGIIATEWVSGKSIGNSLSREVIGLVARVQAAGNPL